ncbi:RagB/SusD family nutrient uptake outer membrane protein [Mucilaginibacter sp. SG564]|uniref:RagB/SusD family nutrient uptake outer membrane protein n=1 Tax=Mucilaginibacter sp. SG564 TaxID=2587022 RepID=UPI0015518781|nr:RagB/SusD family nutrient uptake outer membrane protein [Mucilaginibacter sp. SG564]NOW96012.1 hypothetical protein [Mucilaginibacter sp. SG564]
MKNKLSPINRLMLGMLAMVTVVTSCKKLIEIPGNPPTAITQLQEFTDSATTMTAVAGVYTYSAGRAFAFADGALTYSTALSSDELSSVLSDDAQQFYNYKLTPLNNVVSNLWQFPYVNIYQINAVLNGVKANAALSPSFQKQITGEMEVMRALCYFHMVNIFGGVPVVTGTDYHINARLPRATVDATYAQILTDLNDATKKLTATYPSAGRARPNIYAAQALLAKVNLYKEHWQNAYNEADSVINSGLYSVSDVAVSDVFLSGSNEAIWQLPANQDGYNGVADAMNFIPYNADVIPNYLMTKFLTRAFEANDLRFSNWVGYKVQNSDTLYYPTKYKNRVVTTSPVEDQMIIRLGEVYLIRAEAAAHLNNLVQALADINIIRKRAGLPDIKTTGLAQAAVLAAVMQERRIELFCEWGNRFYDLKRTGTASAVLNSEKTGFTTNASLYPIPQAELLLNNALKQNPGY